MFEGIFKLWAPAKKKKRKRNDIHLCRYHDSALEQSMFFLLFSQVKTT